MTWYGKLARITGRTLDALRVPVGLRDRVVFAVYWRASSVSTTVRRWRHRRTMVYAGSDVGRIFWRVAEPSRLVDLVGHDEPGGK